VKRRIGSPREHQLAVARAGSGGDEAADPLSARKAADDERSRWTAFYGPAELNHLAAVILNRNGEPAKAEAMAHRALAKIPAEFQRNRALATCQLGLAQLRQGEPEQATAIAATVFAIMEGAPTAWAHAHLDRRLPPRPVPAGAANDVRPPFGRNRPARHQ